MNKFTSTLSLLALLASTSLSAAVYQNDMTANPNLQGSYNDVNNNPNLQGNFRDSSIQQNRYFRQGSYDYPSQGTNTVNQGYGQPQPQCPGGNCGANRAWNQNLEEDHYRNQNFSGYSNPNRNPMDNRSQTGFDNQSQMDRYNSQKGNKEWSENDEMTNKIRNKLQNDSSLSADAKNIQITFDEGTAILKGSVNSDAEKTRIQSIVQQVDGVKGVTNKLNVTNK